MHQRKTYKYKRRGMGELVLDDLDNSHDASTDLFSSLTVIVSANPQHHNLQQRKKKETKEHMTEHVIDISRSIYLDFRFQHKDKHNESTVRANKHGHVLYFWQSFGPLG